MSGEKKQRFGRDGDGGYVIVVLPGGGKYDAYISAGIAGDISFDRQFLEAQEVELLADAYDGTIEHLPPNAPPELKFHKANIKAGYPSLNTEYEGKKNVFIKMDIEGSEWEWLEHENALENVKQMVIEMHGVGEETPYWKSPTKNKQIEIFKKINKTHVLVHAHANNNSPYGHTYGKGIVIPQVIELTYLRKNEVSTQMFNKQTNEKGLDFKNEPNQPEITLEHWPFVHFYGKRVSNWG